MYVPTLQGHPCTVLVLDACVLLGGLRCNVAFLSSGPPLLVLSEMPSTSYVLLFNLISSSNTPYSLISAFNWVFVNYYVFIQLSFFCFSFIVDCFWINCICSNYVVINPRYSTFLSLSLFLLWIIFTMTRMTSLFS